MSDGPQHWVFGYGSLIWRADFPFHERRIATIEGWARRFWQGSHDHRGTADAPGRVLTLVEAPGARCLGVAYRIAHAVYEHLDHREKNGYRRMDCGMTFVDGGSAVGTVYLATPDNEAWLGPAPEREIAAHVLASEGPSGRNVDYVLQLIDALARYGVREPHLEAIRVAIVEIDVVASRRGGDLT